MKNSRPAPYPVGGTPREFGAYMESEIEKWRKVIRKAGIEPS